jgi:Nif-specific regulatory protein
LQTSEKRTKEVMAESESLNLVDINTERDNQKNNILYLVAQEMKNPVIRAGGFLSKLFSGQISSLTETNIHYVESIRDDLSKLEKLITQLLELSRCESMEYNPVFDPTNTETVTNKSTEIIKTEAEKGHILSKKQLTRKYNFKGLIGDSPLMKRVYEMIEKIADTDSTILITGESGTGKEIIAKTIHYNSSRSQGPFVPLNCAAIPKDLLESELFGHEKGAFTGALNTRIGRFELAHNGTLFLDEIGELDPSLQVKLLRVLQEREFERVGGVKTIRVDVRILVATNKELEKRIREGKFREDLYYRLNVIPLHLPPLRERVEDILLLVDYFVHEFSKKKGRETLTFSPDALRHLIRYEWPGNVRELENLIERLTILVTANVVTVSDLPEKFHQTADSRTDDRFSTTQVLDTEIPECGIDIYSVVGNIERNLILKALEKTGGVKNRAAKLLGLNRTTLIEKMKKMGIELQKTVTNLPNY